MNYKIEQLEKMLKAETDPNPEIGGYGAHLTHWASSGKSVHLDAEAIRALIRHYEVRAGLRPARKALYATAGSRKNYCRNGDLRSPCLHAGPGV